MRWRNGADARGLTPDMYRLGPGIVVSIQGARTARAHFRAEYALPAAGAESTAPALAVTIRASLHSTRERPRHMPGLSGTHKLAHWRAYMPIRPDDSTMRVTVDVHGPLGLALVQSYVVEPLVSLAAIRAGSVLLPSGGIAQDGKALLLIGRSRSGKSSLAAHALATGKRILGDDQVLLNPERGCLPFPRRLRVYPDLARTAPDAFAALPLAARRALRVLGGVNTLTRGFVAPPVRVSASELGPGLVPLGLPIGEVVVIRRAHVDDLSVQPLERSELATEIEQVLLSQRSEIFRVDELRASFAPLLAREAAITSHALADAPARRVSVPARWSAARAVGQLVRELRLER